MLKRYSFKTPFYISLISLFISCGSDEIILSLSDTIATYDSGRRKISAQYVKDLNMMVKYFYSESGEMIYIERDSLEVGSDLRVYLLGEDKGGTWIMDKMTVDDKVLYEIERELGFIVSTSIADYSRIYSLDTLEATKLIKLQKEKLLPVMESYNGKSLLETMSHKLFVIFDNASNAINFAIDVQEDMRKIKNKKRKKNKDQDKEEFSPDLEYRMGIHFGRVIKKDNQVFGDDMIVADQMMSLSNKGGVVISNILRSMLMNDLEFMEGNNDIEIKPVGDSLGVEYSTMNILAYDRNFQYDSTRFYTIGYFEQEEFSFYELEKKELDKLENEIIRAPKQTVVGSILGDPIAECGDLATLELTGDARGLSNIFIKYSSGNSTKFDYFSSTSDWNQDPCQMDDNSFYINEDGTVIYNSSSIRKIKSFQFDVEFNKEKDKVLNVKENNPNFIISLKSKVSFKHLYKIIDFKRSNEDIFFKDSLTLTIDNKLDADLDNIELQIQSKRDEELTSFSMNLVKSKESDSVRTFYPGGIFPENIKINISGNLLVDNNEVKNLKDSFTIYISGPMRKRKKLVDDRGLARKIKPYCIVSNGLAESTISKDSLLLSIKLENFINDVVRQSIMDGKSPPSVYRFDKGKRNSGYLKVTGNQYTAEYTIEFIDSSRIELEGRWNFEKRVSNNKPESLHYRTKRKNFDIDKITPLDYHSFIWEGFYDDPTKTEQVIFRRIRLENTQYYK